MHWRSSGEPRRSVVSAMFRAVGQPWPFGGTMMTTGRSISMSGTDPFNMQLRAFLRPLPGVRRGGLLSAGGRLVCCPPILSFQLNMIYFGKEKITTRTLGWVCFWVYAENESMALCLFIITYAAIRFPAPPPMNTKARFLTGPLHIRRGHSHGC